MLKTRVLTIVIILTLLIGHAMPLTFAGEAKTVKVLKNVYTIIDGDGVDSNTTIIITTEGVISH